MRDSVLFRLAQHLNDAGSKRWQFLSRDVPDDFVVHAEIVVNEPIAHTRHRPPVNIRKSIPELNGEFLRGLADDLEAPHDGSLERLVPAERVQ
jgi:hypothetical protein